MTTIRGIDTDNYDGDIPLSHFVKLHGLYDVQFCIIGLEAGMPYAGAQLGNALAAGIDVPYCYKFLYWTPNDLERMKAAAGFGKPIAIDCEYGVPAGWSQAQVVQRIHDAKDLLVSLGLYWGIYTGQWWWPGATGNSHDFSHDRLWHAAYPFGDGVVPPKEYLPPSFAVNYGGWTKAEVFQYADACYGDEDGPWALDMNAYQMPVVPPQPVNPPVDGVGLHFTDGSTQQVWPVFGPVVKL